MAAKKNSIRIPICYQLILSYLVLVLAVLLVLSPVLSRAMALSKRSYLAEVEHSLDRSTTLLNSTFKEIYQLPTKLDDYSYYNRLKLSAGTPLPMDSYGAIFMSNKAIAKHFVTLEYVDEVFMYLPNNGVTFGRLRVFETLEDYLKFDLVYENVPSDEVLRWITGSFEISQVFPMETARVHLGEPKKYMLATVRRAGGGTIVGAAISENNLHQLFGMQHLPKNCFLILSDRKGNLLYNHQYKGDIPVPGQSETKLGNERYSILTADTLLPSLRIQLGVPESYFIEQQKPLFNLARNILWTAGAIAVGLSILFALLNALPVRRLLRPNKPRDREKPLSHIREFSDIGSIMHDSAEKIETLETKVIQVEDTLRSNILLQMLYGTIGNTEQALPSRMLPQTSTPYRVAVLTYDVSDKNTKGELVGYLMHTELVEQIDRKTFIPGQISPYKSAVFFYDSAEHVQAMKEIHKALNGIADGVLVTCGVSEALVGKKNVGNAYRHALFSLSQTDVGGFGTYVNDEKVKPQPVGFYGMQRLYNYIIAGDLEQADKLLHSVFTSIRKGQNDGVQVFFLVRFVLESVMRDGGLSQQELALPDYSPSMTAEDVYSAIRSQMAAVVTALEHKRKSGKEQWKSQVLAYIREHISDPELHADNLAELFGVSRNLIYGVVREKTGRSLNEHIEHLRMNLAMELLKTSQHTIMEVARMSGYYSQNTFYKAFKKNFGKAPSSVRS